MTETIARTELDLPLLRRGKVRDVYDLGDALLLVATDRVSAFDVVMRQPVPRKGEVLTLLSAWWFARTADLVPNHFLSVDPEEIAARYPALAPTRNVWARRSMLTRKLQPFPVECVVRGYLAGSAWKEYRESGTLAGEPLPSGLRESDRLPVPLFSPATKAETGHDENISFARTIELVGAVRANQLRERTLQIYLQAADHAWAKGIIIADTKFEFGVDADDRVVLADEVFTPDSSRYWPADHYRAGVVQESFDKQFVRNWLTGPESGWDRAGSQPPPALPDDIIA
ncbi:MAG TPA: phosphoribosylaminoimidazolesuccinocarboxamide synthase, partial [Longimicrobiaceae bacterium]|nr:phosphoribosylaminoimidazolesuccinocarboxamide synthase [Longimicrobiaceae bacterium]